MKGSVRKVFADKGFGFIRGADGKDYFFHRTVVQNVQSMDDVNEGAAVEFEGTEGPKGPFAEDVFLQ